MVMPLEIRQVVRVTEKLGSRGSALVHYKMSL